MGMLLKVLLIVVVILVVWWVVKFRGRMSVLKAAVRAAKKVADDEKARASGAANTGAKVPVTLVACPKCGTYNAPGVACVCQG